MPGLDMLSTDDMEGVDILYEEEKAFCSHATKKCCFQFFPILYEIFLHIRLFSYIGGKNVEGECI